MHIRLTILIVSLSLSLYSKCQVVNFDTLKMPTLVPLPLNHVDSPFIFQCRAQASYRYKNPLFIINNKRFKNCTLSNFYGILDNNIISSFRVIPIEESSTSLYHKASKNGVIILTVVPNIEWVLVRNVLKKHSKLSHKSIKETLIKLNDSTLVSATDRYYFPKNLIAKISVQHNSIHMYNGTIFTNLATIILKNSHL